jgi:hypothetical protein
MFEIKYLSRQRILFTQWQTCYLESEYTLTVLNLHLIKYIVIGLVLSDLYT